MSDATSNSPAPAAHRFFYYAGFGILVLGLAGAVLIFLFAAGNEVDAADEIANARMYQHNLELMGGKLSVYIDELSRWFASLWHGKALAYTVGLLAVATATVCFVLAKMLSKPLPADPNESGSS